MDKKYPMAELKEQDIRSLIDNLSDGILLADVETKKLLFGNRAILEMLGYTSEEIRGLSVRDIHPKESLPMVLGVFKRQVDKRERIIFDIPVKRKNNEIFYADISSLPITLSGKEYLAGVFRDISRRKKLEIELLQRLKQQDAVVKLGQAVLSGIALDLFMNEAVRVLASVLGVEYTKILELSPEGDYLLLRAGVGWKEGLVGVVQLKAGRDSQAGYTLMTKEPVIVEDLRTEKRFSMPSLLVEHNVISGLSVIIGEIKKPFGVLGAHTGYKRIFTRDDVNFVQAIANLLAIVIERVKIDKETQLRYEQIEKFNRVMLGREEKLIELKEEVNTLLKFNGKPEKYKV
ncbi:PAS domain S-box protein [bacterium]|nr:MAG: PAS domain S-box protein [bacterium]